MKFPYKIIDLTHTLSSNIPTWNGSCGFEHKITVDYDDCTTDVKFRVQKLAMHAGIGTHMDAPAHCIKDGATIDKLSIQDFLSPLVVIDVSAKMHERYSVSIEDINIEIPPRSFVMIRTGWEKFWHEPAKYHNNHIFPSISAEVAEFLLTKDIVGIGIDTLSPDRPEDGYPVHRIILGAGKYIIENAANLLEMPVEGAWVLVLPIKVAGGTEAPVRLVGFVYTSDS